MRDGHVDLFILAARCPRCQAVSLHLPWRRDQELRCGLCSRTLGVIDACLIEH